MRAIKWILASVFLTASFDVVLLVRVGGSIRFSQLLLGILCVAALAKVIQDGRILWPRGATSLSFWLLCQLLFLPFSGIMSLGAAFFALLTFTIIGFFAVIQLYGKSLDLEPLVRLYLVSYVFVGLFGLLQFATPLLGLPGILVKQWIIHGKVARINGFSFEPSYFATYMMMGWIMLVELRLSKAEIARGRLWKWATVAVTLSLILSSSKTAWVIMLVELIARVLPLAWRGLRSALRQAAQGRMAMLLPGRSLLLSAVVVVGSTLGAVHFFPKLLNGAVLLSGTGLYNTPAHSYIARAGVAAATYEAFLEHPFIGRSLGGVPVYLGSREGFQVKTMEDLRLHEGFPVILEVLAASGVIGIIPFLVFVFANTLGALRTATRYWPSEQAKWVRALARAMIFECLVLLADQNLLRVYLWVHLSMVSLVAYNLEFGTAAELAPAVSGSPSLPLLETVPTA